MTEITNKLLLEVAEEFVGFCDDRLVRIYNDTMSATENKEANYLLMDLIKPDGTCVENGKCFLATVELINDDCLEPYRIFIVPNENDGNVYLTRPEGPASDKLTFVGIIGKIVDKVIKVGGENYFIKVKWTNEAFKESIVEQSSSLLSEDNPNEAFTYELRKYQLEKSDDVIERLQKINEDTGIDIDVQAGPNEERDYLHCLIHTPDKVYDFYGEPDEEISEAILPSINSGIDNIEIETIATKEYLEELKESGVYTVVTRIRGKFKDGTESIMTYYKYKK